MTREGEQGEGDSFAPLRRSIERLGHQFSLHFVEAPVGARDELAKALSVMTSWAPAPLFLTVLAPGALGAAHLEDLLRGRDGTKDALFAMDGDALLTDEHAPLVDALNLARDRLPTLVRGPFILGLLGENIPRFASRAPDLYAIRATVTRFDEREAQTWARDAYASKTQKSGPWFEERLEAGERMGASPAALADAWLQLASGSNGTHHHEGQEPIDHERVARAIREARRLARLVGYERVIALADLLEVRLAAPDEARGDEARLRDALDVLRRVGSAADRAVAWLALAGARWRDDPIAAERIITDEVLPELAAARDGDTISEVVANHCGRVVRAGRPFDALAFAEAVAGRWQQLFTVSARARVSFVRSQLFELCGDIESAVRFADDSVGCARKLGVEPGLVSSLLRSALSLSARRAPGDANLARLRLDEADRLTRTELPDLRPMFEDLAPQVLSRLGPPPAPPTANRAARRSARKRR